MPKEATEKKPAGWQKLRRENDPQGGETGFDEESQRLYRVLANGSIVFNENPPGKWKTLPDDSHVFIPAGYRFDEQRHAMFEIPPEPDGAEKAAGTTDAAPAAQTEEKP